MSSSSSKNVKPKGYSVLAQLLNNNKEDHKMKPLDYINNLMNFYLTVSHYPLSKIVFYEPAMKVEVRFKDQVSVVDYNLGFLIGKTCYITQKRAQMNVRVLEAFLSPDLDEFMVSVKINKKDLELYAYNIYGRRVLRGKIKFASINWFLPSTKPKKPKKNKKLKSPKPTEEPQEN